VFRNVARLPGPGLAQPWPEVLAPAGVM